MHGLQTRLNDPSRCFSLITSKFIMAGRMIQTGDNVLVTVCWLSWIPWSRWGSLTNLLVQRSTQWSDEDWSMRWGGLRQNCRHHVEVEICLCRLDLHPTSDTICCGLADRLQNTSRIDKQRHKSNVFTIYITRNLRTNSWTDSHQDTGR